MKMTKLASSLLVASAFSLAAGGAHAYTVAGVTWDENSVFDFEAKSSLYETIGVAVGDTFSGYGSFTSLNGDSAFCSNCQLTYEFGGYTITSSTIVPTAEIGDTFTASGGWLNVYVQDMGAGFTAFNPTVKSTATDGQLWLALTGANGIYTAPDTLAGSLTAVSSAGPTGQGTGYFDVVGGLAAIYLDTNGEPGGADFTYTSSFQPIGTAISNNGVIVATHSGTNEVKGTSVPEPATLALLGLGLVGLGLSRRNKKAA